MLHSALAYGVLSRGDVALFLPFGRNNGGNGRQKRHKAKAEIAADFHYSDCTIQQW